MVATLVRRAAKELAGAFYDNQDVLSDGRYERTERFRQSYPQQADFVREQWPSFVKHARIILAQMLNEPGRSPRERDEIYDALLKDRGQMTDLDRLAPSIMRLN